MIGYEPCAKDGELALEHAEWRRAGDRQSGYQEEGTADRHGMNDASLGAAEQIALQMLLHVPGAEEQQWLGHGMKGEVKQHSERAPRATEAESKNHDSAMIYAGVRQNPAETSLDQDERDRDAHR